MLRKVAFILSALACNLISAQTGPNNPAVTSNNTSIGTNAWTNVNRIASNNVQYATNGTKGTTNYLTGSSYGFAIAGTQQIDGILVEIDRATTSHTQISQLNGWTTGMSKTISAGTARCLLATVLMENGLGTRNITSLTYGGQAMTSVLQASVGTTGGFIGKIHYFILLEAGITAASSTNFNITFDGTPLDENWETISSAVFQYVDQTIPIFDTETLVSNNANNPVTLGSAITCGSGGVIVSTIFCGNNRTPAATPGQSNNYSISPSFVETIDTYSANASASTSGGAWQIAQLPLNSGGSATPTYTFAGTVNRQVAALLSLQNLREYDNSVRLMKGGAFVGNNLANTTAPWPIADAYASYGGATNLWGTTWTPAEVNNVGFGVGLSAVVQNGTAEVDHIRITIFSSLNLPVELSQFYVEKEAGVHKLQWRTQTELMNKCFVIERGDAAGNFVSLDEIAGQGTSSSAKDYSFTDDAPLDGINYYRLKQIDFDGSFSYSWIVAINNSSPEDDLILYPNPTQGQIQISKRATTGQMQLFDENMRLLKVFEENMQNASISDLPDGVYFLIYEDKGIYKTKKLSKKSH